MQNVELPRDRWGRPMVIPPNARKNAKRVAYRRTTTFVGCLDDTAGLMKWMSRQVAYGMGQRKDLVLAAAAANPEDKRKLGEIADKAAEHAKGMSGDAAETGTALHSLTERVDRGERLGVIPAEYKADIEAYRRATEAIEFTAIETFRVHDEWQVAGTADRIGTLHGRTMIMDIKGLSLDTKIPTPSGWTTMGAVAVGDRVLDENGKPCTVIIKSEPKRIGTYIVTFDDGSSVVCDTEHIWWTTTNADRQAGRPPVARPITEVIATLKRGRQNQHCVPVARPLELPDSELPCDPYLLGVWLGDGHTNRNVITKGDDLFDVIASDGHILGSRQVDTRSGCVSRSVVGLHDLLTQAGVLGNKHIPPTYLRASTVQRTRLLQGLMDSDGTWNTARNRAMFTSTSKELALGVEELLLTLGQRTNIAEVRRAGYGKTVTAYDVEFTPRELMPFRLPRKAAKVEPKQVPTHSGRRVIVSVETGPDVETACIGVDSPNHVYLCSEHFIPTHNTGSIDYPHKMAMQLAMYSRSVPYDIPTDTRGQDPEPVSPNRGVIIHLPAGQGRCDLYEIDINVGWGACVIARQVWNWRGRKDITRLIDPDQPPAGPPTWESLIRDARNLDDLRLIWTRAKECGHLTAELKAAAKARSEELAA